jgi:hypothetical protein
MRILNGMQTRDVTVCIIMMIHLFFITPISYFLSLWAFMGTFDAHRVTEGNYIDPVVTNYSTVCINGKHLTWPKGYRFSPNVRPPCVPFFV